MSKKTALITGISGQDGSYLAELLLEKGYEVHGIIRRTSTTHSHWRIEHIADRLQLHHGDIMDGSRMMQIVLNVAPDEIYHLACQSHVGSSFDQPIYTIDSILTGTANILQSAIKCGDKSHLPRFYQASSSEMFGSSPPPQTEETPFCPRSPYACAKLAAYWCVRNYREAYGLHASNGVLFNHESPRRGEEFVTRKITRAAARIKLGLQDNIYLGNIDTMRDFGHARDYVRAMWLMLQQDEPDDYIIATGWSRQIRDFLVRVFDILDLKCADYVILDDPEFLRPLEVSILKGDATKAKRELKWGPEISFDELVREMVFEDLEREKRLARIWP